LLKNDAPSAEQRRFVGHGLARAIFHAPGVADKARKRNFGCERFQFIDVPVEKSGTFQQVQGRIAAEAKLGENSEIRSSLLGLLRQAQDASGIPCEIANGGIELRERYFHARTTLRIRLES